MKKTALTILLLSAMLSLYGCGTQTAEPYAETAPPVTREIGTETEMQTTATEATTRPPMDYVHSEGGYFNLLEEYPEIEMKGQIGGTCWLFSAAINMQTSYRMKNGTSIELDPMEMLDQIYTNEKDEGFIPDEGINKQEVGGWQWVVTETLSNGFGDLVMDSSIILDASDRDAIKENLHDRGGVSVGVNDTNNRIKGWFGKYYTLNYTDPQFDHDVTIVGYDDHFPKEYFKKPAENDGAWIAYNSAMNNQYFYISYEAPLEYAISHSFSDQYTAVVGYDAGNEQDRYIRTGNATTTANVFHHAGTLAAVGTYNDFDEQAVTIAVYDSSFKNLLYSQEAVLDYHGYHTITLDTPVPVSDCAVAVTYSKGAPVEGETIDCGHMDYVTKAEKGQSFVKIGGTWRDLTESGIEAELGLDCKPGNSCIKALYQ